MGRRGQSARRRLRARRRTQRPRLRRSRRSAGADAPRARDRHAGPRRERLARRPERLRLSDLPDHARRADRAERRRNGRLGRHVDGRAPRHRRRGAAEEPDRAARRQRRRARHRAGGARSHPRLLRRSIPTSRRTTRSSSYIRTVSAPFGRLTDAQWEHVTRTNVRQRADGRWRLAYDPGIAVPFRASRRAAGSVGRLGRDPLPDARAARRAVGPAFGGHGGARWRRAGRSRRSSNSPDVGHAPMLLSAEQIDPVARFLRAARARHRRRSAPRDGARRRACSPGAIAPPSLTIAVAHGPDAQPSAARPAPGQSAGDPPRHKSASGSTRR